MHLAHTEQKATSAPRLLVRAYGGIRRIKQRYLMTVQETRNKEFVHIVWSVYSLLGMKRSCENITDR